MRGTAQWQHRTGAQFALVAVKKKSPACEALDCAWEPCSTQELGLKLRYPPYLVTAKELAPMLGCSWRHALTLATNA